MQFRKTKPKAFPEQIEAAEELERKACAHDADRSRSQDESDADGFLSQHASGLIASRDRLNAEILRNGGYAEFTVLVDKHGDIIADEIDRDDYGNLHWLLWSGVRKKYNRFFIPFGSRSRIQKRLGMSQVKYWSPAKAVIGNNIAVPERLKGDELSEFIRKVRKWKKS